MSTDFFCTGKSYRLRHTNETTIDMLSEDVLLEIFDYCEMGDIVNHRTNPYQASHDAHGAWHSLVHVCRRWRQTIFASPRRLKLKLLCTNGTPVRENLDHFPILPIVIRYGNSFTPRDEDNLFAALEHPDRVFYIDVYSSNSRLRKMAAVMQKSFPVLTVLQLSSIDGVFWNIPALPHEFLNGSAPSLREISSNAVPFPALPTLLSSAKDLVVLRLKNIPGIGYVSPEAMVVCLATLTRLETLHIEFRSPSSLPSRIRLPPETRAVLPALTSFGFGGVCEYLEDLVSQIDCPQLDRIDITINYFSGDDFRVAQLMEFVNRSDRLRPTLFRRASISCGGIISFSVVDNFWSAASIRILCGDVEWLVSEMTHILCQFSAILSYVAHLEISGSGVGACDLQAVRAEPA